MGEVLSQSEIDDLLKALSSGELDVDEMKNGEEKQVKNYDFARPSKFSKEHLRTLEIIFEHFGRLLATNLPAYLRKAVSVDVVNSEVVIYSEFSNALSNPVLLGVVSMAPLSGNMVMEIASNLGFAFVDRLLGGAGAALDKEREFSEIELSIIERIFSICVNLLREPWENVIKVTPRLERIETNSQFAQIISPTETIAIITINLKIGDVEGLVNVCLPFTLLEPVWTSLIRSSGLLICRKKILSFMEMLLNRQSAGLKYLLRHCLVNPRLMYLISLTFRWGTLLKLIKKLIRNSMFMLATSRSLKHYLVTLKINTQLE